jgi:eukaryotic-like serine/threonine-protein kinase
MGEVYLAIEMRLNRKVALKLLPLDLTRDPTRVRRFEQEAQAASALNHPNVITMYALGETTDGQHYIAMEYVDGHTLRDRLVRERPRFM